MINILYIHTWVEVWRYEANLSFESNVRYLYPNIISYENLNYFAHFDMHSYDAE